MALSGEEIMEEVDRVKIIPPLLRFMRGFSA